MYMSITEQFRNEIVTTLVNPSLQRDVQDYIQSRYRSRHWANRLELCGCLFAGFAGLSSTASLAYQTYATLFTYVSVINASTSVVCLTLGAFMQKRNHINTTELNNVLRSLGIKIKFIDEDDKQSRERKSDFDRIIIE